MEGLNTFLQPLKVSESLVGLYLTWVAMLFLTGVAVVLGGWWAKWITYRDKKDLDYREDG